MVQFRSLQPKLQTPRRLRGGRHRFSVGRERGKRVVQIKNRQATKIWDAGTGEGLRVIPTSRTEKAVFSPDGLLVGTHDFSRLRLWNAATGEEVSAAADLLVQLESDDFRIDSFAFSPDSKWLAAGGHEGNNSVERIREVSGREVRTLRAPGPPDSIAFSPNGTLLAAVTREFNPDKIFIVSWDVISGMQLFSQQQQANPAVRLTFGPDSQMLAATVADDGAKPSMNEIKLIDPRAGNVVQEKVVPEQSGFSSAVAYSPDGKIHRHV